MTKTFEWKKSWWMYTCEAGPFTYSVLTLGDSTVQAVRTGHGVGCKRFPSNAEPEAKLWCESHYRQWYASLPVPTQIDGIYERKNGVFTRLVCCAGCGSVAEPVCGYCHADLMPMPEATP